MSQTSSAQNKALALPEIRLLIGHFLALHDHLQCLQVSKACRNNTVIPISAMQSNATHVHSLQLVSRVPYAYLKPEALCNLRTLSISQDMTKVPPEDKYWQLLTRLIRKNSLLHDITLSRATLHSETTTGFWNAIVHVPQIKELHIDGYNEHYDSPEELCYVCRNATSLESFSLNVAIFIGSKTVECLAQYPDFTSIKRLKIRKIDESSFAGDVLLASNIVRGCAWGCTRLKELKIDIEIDFDPDETIMRRTLSTQHQQHHAINDEDANNKAAEVGEKVQSRDELQRIVFQQLGRLHHLEILGLYCTPVSYPLELPPKTKLDLDLNHGLDLLVNLSRIRRLIFYKTQALTPQDVKWMSRHWPRLRILSSLLNKDKVVQAQLASVCSLLGIELRTDSEATHNSISLP
ncbi:hypothetical protein BG011_006191 [Mortierella polycephala]|uniref:F-box domain-containing protein n=1 Tax=Mortierella polycephala TaxID=41804 RepID=A0A9P6U0B9_9FUNG|nr:hypothetical protein BG011_006191 [Mortierella polycephala]